MLIYVAMILATICNTVCGLKTELVFKKKMLDNEKKPFFKGSLKVFGISLLVCACKKLGLKSDSAAIKFLFGFIF